MIKFSEALSPETTETISLQGVEGFCGYENKLVPFIMPNLPS